MRKQVFGRHLKRDTNERKALFKGLASSLVMHERIETTHEKAKAIQGYVEKLVTKAKNNESVQAQRLLEAYLSHEALKKMMTDVAPRFVDRPGGYTRILKIGNRFSDNASMVIMEWVTKVSPVTVIAPQKTKVKPVVKKEAKVVVEEKKSIVKKSTKSVAKKTAVKKTTKKEGTK